MRVNTQALVDKLDASGLKKGYICEQIGLSRQGLDKKINGKIPFRISEIYVICDLAKITQEERVKIFCPDVE